MRRNNMKKLCIIWAGSGVGEALAKYYSAEWLHVDEITRKQVDLSREEDIMKLAEEISQSDYDLVIFSAGVWYHRTFGSLSFEEISEQILVNTIAPLQILRTLWEQTKFVYLSSVMQYIPAKNMSVYASMKRATSQTLRAIRIENSKKKILDIDLWAVKTPMHLKAGMKKMVGKDLEQVIPKLVKKIENKQGSRTLFWDWWIMIYLVFPIYRIFLTITK